MSRGSRSVDRMLENFWFENYAPRHHCGLCGNSGVVDTTGVTTAAGLQVGGRFLCLCPNGQALRSQGVDPAMVDLSRHGGRT